jgi:hypothetical protein
MTNDVWEFKQFSNGKIELVGRMTPKNDDPTQLRGAVQDIEYHGHTLSTWVIDGLAEKCRTCDAIGLVKGQTCAMINKYNDEKHPL